MNSYGYKLGFNYFNQENLMLSIIIGKNQNGDENIIEKYFVLPRLQKQQEMANKEREMNLLKVRKNDPHVNRSRFKVITNERYEKID